MNSVPGSLHSWLISAALWSAGHVLRIVGYLNPCPLKLNDGNVWDCCLYVFRCIQVLQIHGQYFPHTLFLLTNSAFKETMLQILNVSETFGSNTHKYLE